MKISYSFWETIEGRRILGAPIQTDVQVEPAIAILDELSQEPLAFQYGDGKFSDRAWISFLDAPRFLHVYFTCVPDRIRYEYFESADQDLSGIIGLEGIKEGVRLYSRNRSLFPLLRSLSIEIDDDGATE